MKQLIVHFWKDTFKIYYHQYGAQLNNSDQRSDIIFAQTIFFHQIGNGYLQFDLAIRKNRLAVDPPDPITPAFIDWDFIILNNNAFASTFKVPRLAIAGGSDLRHNKRAGGFSNF